MTHFCQYRQRTFSGRFNRDRHEAVGCPKLFDGEEVMTRFSNEEEDCERRKKKYEADNQQENDVTEDDDEGDDDVRTKAQVTKKLTKMKQMKKIWIVTQKVKRLIHGINYEKKLSMA